MKVLTHLESGVEVDVCRRCHVIWLDASEREQLPQKIISTEPTSKEYHEELKKLDDYRGRGTDWISNLGPVQYFLMYIGLPVEIRKGNYKRSPEITSMLLFLTVLISCYCFYDESALTFLSFEQSSSILKKAFTSFSVFFVHADLLHLFSNIYFLYLFGHGVENELGIGKFMRLVFLSTIVGTLSYALFFASADSTLVGASGGISGVIAFYLFRFPQSRFAIAIWFFPRAIPGWALGLFFVMSELFGLYMQSLRLTNVSHMSHLGGALVGAAFYFWYFKDLKIENSDFIPIDSDNGSIKSSSPRTSQ